jgi:hypothetical protein
MKHDLFPEAPDMGAFYISLSSDCCSLRRTPHNRKLRTNKEELCARSASTTLMIGRIKSWNVRNAIGRAFLSQGSVEYYDELMDCHCPRCGSLEAPMLAIVSYPTLEKARANADKPGIREWVQRIDAGLDKFAREKLREPEQLPEINEDSFTLVWDNDHSNCDDRRTLIKHGDTIIFSEPARWEEYVRFEQVADILKAKYGHRLKDLVPAPRSEDWLWGDKWSAPDYVDSVREKSDSRAARRMLGSRFLSSESTICAAELFG